MASVQISHADGLLKHITMYDVERLRTHHVPPEYPCREFVSINLGDGIVELIGFLSLELAIDLRDRLVAMELALPQKEVSADVSS